MQFYNIELKTRSDAMNDIFANNFTLTVFPDSHPLMELVTTIRPFILYYYIRSLCS